MHDLEQDEVPTCSGNDSSGVFVYTKACIKGNKKVNENVNTDNNIKSFGSYSAMLAYMQDLNVFKIYASFETEEIEDQNGGKFSNKISVFLSLALTISTPFSLIKNKCMAVLDSGC